MTHDNDEFDEVELQALLDHAKRLPREIPPAPATWTNIRDRIEQTRVREFTPPIDASKYAAAEQPFAATPTDVRKSKRTWMTLAAAAALFVAVTSLVVMREHAAEQSASPVIATARPEVSEPSLPTTNTASPSIELVFAQYDEATSDLTKDLEQRRSRMEPSAVATIDSCITTIDRAIKESRTALRESPDNAVIADLLQLSYQQKLDLLRRAAELPLGSL